MIQISVQQSSRLVKAASGLCAAVIYWCTFAIIIGFRCISASLCFCIFGLGLVRRPVCVKTGVCGAVGFILVHSHPAGVSNAAPKDYGCGISEQQCIITFLEARRHLNHINPCTLHRLHLIYIQRCTTSR